MQRASNRIAHQIAEEIAAIGPYRLITDGSELPVVAFTLAPDVTNYIAAGSVVDESRDPDCTGD